MGQCVLRDMGFDFEKDPAKKQMLDDYLRDKLAVKYPEAQNVYRIKNLQDSTGIIDDGFINAKTATPDEDSPGMDGRLSRPMRKAKFKEMMIQTEAPGDDSLRQSRFRSYENQPPKSITDSNKGDRSPLSIMNSQRSKTDAIIIKDDASSQYQGLYEVSNGRFQSTPNPSALQSPPENSNLRSSRMKSENGRVESWRKSNVSPQRDMFKGIENIDFKDPSKSPQNFGTGRSKNIVLKGFQNKYFHNYKDQTPSPKREEIRVFDDDDEEDFPYDDY